MYGQRRTLISACERFIEARAELPRVGELVFPLPRRGEIHAYWSVKYGDQFFRCDERDSCFVNVHVSNNGIFAV